MEHALFIAESFGGCDGDGVAGGQQAGEECAESEESVPQATSVFKTSFRMFSRIQVGLGSLGAPNLVGKIIPNAVRSPHRGYWNLLINYSPRRAFMDNQLAKITLFRAFADVGALDRINGSFSAEFRFERAYQTRIIFRF